MSDFPLIIEPTCPKSPLPCQRLDIGAATGMCVRDGKALFSWMRETGSVAGSPNTPNSNTPVVDFLVILYPISWVNRCNILMLLYMLCHMLIHYMYACICHDACWFIILWTWLNEPTSKLWYGLSGATNLNFERICHRCSCGWTLTYVTYLSLLRCHPFWQV